MTKTFVRLALVLLIFSGNWIYGQDIPAKFKKVQRVIDKAIEDGLTGVSVYINHPKHGEWQGTSGFANLETKEVLLPEHVFCLASLGKTYAATAAMLMHEEGLLNLDARIGEYLPASVVQGIPHAETVTVRQLMNMTSGFYNYDRSPELNELYLSGKLKLDTISHSEVLRQFVFDQEPNAIPTAAPISCCWP